MIFPVQFNTDTLSNDFFDSQNKVTMLSLPKYMSVFFTSYCTVKMDDEIPHKNFFPDLCQYTYVQSCPLYNFFRLSISLSIFYLSIFTIYLNCIYPQASTRGGVKDIKENGPFQRRKISALELIKSIKSDQITEIALTTSPLIFCSYEITEDTRKRSIQ